jgi:hypothetical protein
MFFLLKRILRFVAERNINYGLSFDGNQSDSYILYHKVKGFKAITVCAWLKVPSLERNQCLFSIYNENQRFQMCFSNNSRNINIKLNEVVE